MIWMRLSLGLCALLSLPALGCRGTTVIAHEHLDTVGATDGSELDSASDTGADTVSDVDTGTGSETGAQCDRPDSFSWTSSNLLIPPPSFATSIKDPTIAFANDRWYLYVTTSA